MTDWLARLRSLEKSPDPQAFELPKLPKAASGSFGGASSGESAKIPSRAGCPSEPLRGAFGTFGSSVPQQGAKIPSSPRDVSDWRECFEERLAVAMVDGEAAETAARAIAWASCIARWRDLNPVASDPGRCVWCGEPDEPGNIVPFGVGPHVWLHDNCWPAWNEARQAEAEAALSAMLGDVENE